MQIAILSFYSGLVDRGVETWASDLKNNLPDEVEVYPGSAFRSIKKWTKADLVIPTNGRGQVFLCRIATWLAGKPMVVFGHSGPGADDKWNLLCSPNVFVAFSSAQRKWAEKYKLPWTKVRLVHHAVDLNKFKPTKKPREKVVLCVAANTPDKRVGLVKRAVDALSGFKFIAVGRGNAVELSHSAINKIYNKADVFCFVPKSHEAFGLVFLEALASNLPVVTINDETRREIVGRAGIFVGKPEDSALLASAIERAYNRNWGVAPRKQAEKFGWQNMVPKYKNLFAETL